MEISNVNCGFVVLFDQEGVVSDLYMNQNESDFEHDAKGIIVRCINMEDNPDIDNHDFFKIVLNDNKQVLADIGMVDMEKDDSLFEALEAAKQSEVLPFKDIQFPINNSHSQEILNKYLKYAENSLSQSH